METVAQLRGAPFMVCESRLTPASSKVRIPGWIQSVPPAVLTVSNRDSDFATFENPHQYSVGVRDVFVNGKQVLKNGEHTGVKPGRALWGPGKIGGN